MCERLMGLSGITPDGLVRLMQSSEEVTVIDVNSRGSWMSARVPGAMHLGLTAPRWLLRDRDAIYGDLFRRRGAGMGIGEVVTSPGVRWSAADTIDLSDAPPDLSTSLARDAHEAQERTGSCGVARPRRTPSEVNPVFG